MDVEKERLVCRYYVADSCPEGDLCPLPHVRDGNRIPDTLCRFFMKGYCHFGLNCLYDHTDLGKKDQKKRQLKNCAVSKKKIVRILEMPGDKTVSSEDLGTATSPNTVVCSPNADENVLELQTSEAMQQLAKATEDDALWKQNYDYLFPPLPRANEPILADKRDDNKHLVGGLFASVASEKDSKCTRERDVNIGIHHEDVFPPLPTENNQQFTGKRNDGTSGKEFMDLMADKMLSDLTGCEKNLGSANCLSDIWKDDPPSLGEYYKNKKIDLPSWNPLWGDTRKADNILEDYNLTPDFSKLKVVDRVSGLFSEYSPLVQRRRNLYEMWKGFYPCLTDTSLYDTVWKIIKGEDWTTEDALPDFMSFTNNSTGTVSPEQTYKKDGVQILTSSCFNSKKETFFCGVLLLKEQSKQ